MTDLPGTLLLDVNVLVALVDPKHVHHDLAHAWFERTGAADFATCPLTENGLLRVVGHPRYPHGAGSPAMVAPLLAGIRALPGHHFWPDIISLVDSEFVDPTRLTSSGQLTDVYLLALAVANSGSLATFDRRLATSPVRDGADAVHLIEADPA